MKTFIAAAGIGLALTLLPQGSSAQVPTAGAGSPTGVCQTWNGREYVTRPCASVTGTRQEREPAGPSAEDEAHGIDRVGRRLYEQGKFEEALVQFERARSVYSRDGAAYYGICLVNAAWGNYPNAHSHCSVALQYGTRDVWSVSQGELRQYIESLRTKSDQQRETFNREADEREFQKCQSFYEGMDLERALYFLDYYTESQLDMRHRQEAYVMKGTVLTRLGRFTEAEQAFYKAYTLNPQKALKDVEQKNHPNLADALWDLEASRALSIKADDLDSKLFKVSLLQQSLRFSPDNYRSLYWLGDTEMEVYHYQEADAHLRQAIASHVGAQSVEQADGSQAQHFYGYPPAPKLESGAEFRLSIIRDVLQSANNAVKRGADRQAQGATDGDGLFLEWPSFLLGEGYMLTGKPEQAQSLLQGLIAKFPDNEIFRKDAQILSRIALHQPRYINEARRQAEAARKNGMEGVLYEVDQNMRCVAGQTFDGAGSCINNGFIWP